MASLFEVAVLGLLHVVTFVYDVVSFVPYYLICRPDLKVMACKREKAKSISGDPSGPYRCVEIGNKKLSTSLCDDCTTLDELFIRAAQLFTSSRCLGTRDLLSEEDEMQPNGKVFKKLILGEYRWITYEEMLARLTNFGSGLLALGQKPRKNTLIFAETKAEWMIAAQACFKYNFPVVTLYATLGEEAIIHGINEAEVSYVITSTTLLPKFKGIMKDIPKVTHIICIGNGKSPKSSDFPSHVKVMSMDEVENIGAEPENIQTPVTKPRPEDIAVIMYTSGSTGKPKGVLISHANLMAGMSGQCEKIVGLGPADVYVGYLPLAHVLELSAEISCLSNGTPIGYSSPLTLTDNSSKIKRGSRGDLSVLKPTLMAAVPVIMDRLYKGVWEKVSQGGTLSKLLFEFAYDYKLKRLEKGYDSPLLNRIVFSKVQTLLGGNIRMMLSGGAPLSQKTQRFMNVCFCCPVLQGYGLTETCGAGTITEVSDFSTGRVGAPLICSELRLRDWAEGECIINPFNPKYLNGGYTSRDKPHPRGEILLGGGNIVQGYYKNEAKTKEDFTEIEGVRYFCTGDVGSIDTDGCLRIIDRIKDLVKLQGGEYVALSQVETVLNLCPLVDQICVYADSNQSYTVAFIVPNKLNLEELGKELNLAGEYEELCCQDVVEKKLLKRMTNFGIKSKLDKSCIPLRIKVCPEPWMPESGLVTDSMKLKRKQFELIFKEDIARMYKK